MLDKLRELANRKKAVKDVIKSVLVTDIFLK